MIMKGLSFDKWKDAFDVVIIGSGFSGLAAAIEAKSYGASVLILEKRKGCGGNSIICDGFFAAAGTDIQKKAGIEDTPEKMVRDMLNAGRHLNNKDLASIVTTGSNSILSWTMDEFGMEYQDLPLQMDGHSVCRIHLPKGYSGLHAGALMIRRMLRKAKSLGVEIRTRTPLCGIIKNDHETVVGVKVRTKARKQSNHHPDAAYIRAKKAVVIAAGGFSGDTPFRTIHAPCLNENFENTNRPGTTAEALIELAGVGASTLHLSRIQLGPWATPDEKGSGYGVLFADKIVFQYGMVINPATGRRFVCEQTDRKTLADAILRTGNVCIGIVDASSASQDKELTERCLKKNIICYHETLDEFSETYQIPPQATPKFHPPFYSIRLWPKVHYTMGGVRINSKAQVIAWNDSPIKRLYAAGEVTGGIHGACRLAGCAITDCLVFGRIAGKNAVTENLV